MTDDKQQARDMLARKVNKVPPSIASASVQMVRQWKDLNAKAAKALASSKASRETLVSLCVQLDQFK